MPDGETYRRVRCQDCGQSLPAKHSETGDPCIFCGSPHLHVELGLSSTLIVSDSLSVEPDDSVPRRVPDLGQLARLIQWLLEKGPEIIEWLQNLPLFSRGATPRAAREPAARG